MSQPMRLFGLGAMTKRASFVDRCYVLRDAMLGRLGFQRFAASFPLTRRIAHAQARALFDLCAGFVYSQVLTACVRLDLFGKLASGPKTAATLSHELALPPHATERLLLAAVSLRLLSRRAGNRFGLGMLGAALNGNPGIAAMIEHNATLYRDLQDPLALLRGHTPHTELSQYWPYAGAPQPETLDARDVAGYSALMAASQSFIAADVLDAYPFRQHRCVLDVGGGEGAFIAAAADRFKMLRYMLFDLPAVAERASQHFAAAGLGERARVHGGSFLSDALPQGADLVTLVRVLHDHDDASVLRVLRAVLRALPANGTLLVAEPMSGVSGAEPVGDAYFGMYLLAMGSGRPRTPEHIGRLLERAGFTDIRLRKTRRPMLVGVMTARPQKETADHV